MLPSSSIPMVMKSGHHYLRLTPLVGLGIAGWIGCLGSTLAQGSGRYRLEGGSVDGGGGRIRGGVYEFRGIIGQPEAGGLQGGRFRLEGGLAGGLTVVRTPGAPFLRIRRQGADRVILSWPVDATGFVLESCADPAGKVWAEEEGPVGLLDGEHAVTVSAMGMKCFRLRSR